MYFEKRIGFILEKTSLIKNQSAATYLSTSIERSDCMISKSKHSSCNMVFVRATDDTRSFINHVRNTFLPFHCSGVQNLKCRRSRCGRRKQTNTKFTTQHADWLISPFRSVLGTLSCGCQIVGHCGQAAWSHMQLMKRQSMTSVLDRQGQQTGQMPCK